MAYGTSGRHTDVALRTAAALAVAPSPEALRDAARDILATGPYDLGTGLRLLLDATVSADARP